MPWVIYDHKDNTYLCEEAYASSGDGDLLWQEDVQSATKYASALAATKAFADIDVDELLPHIVPLWVELGPAEKPRRPWNALTMDEKIKQLEDDLEETLAARVQRAMLYEEPGDPLTKLHFEGFERVDSGLGPTVQHFRRIKDPIYPIQGTASDMVGARATYDALKKITHDRTFNIVAPKAPVYKPRTLEQEVEALSFAGAFDTPALIVDFAPIEMRTFHQFKKRESNGREEERFELLCDRKLRSDQDGGAPRSGLSDHEVLPEDGGGPGSRNGGEG